MAVRHGHGKLAGTDALIFAYDTGDTRNSFRGEPTTNLLPNGVAAGHNSGGYGNVVTVTDADAEKGLGWKKVTISNRGNNFRIIQWTYLTMSANIMYCHSVFFDWGNMRDKGYFLYFDGNGNGIRAYYRPGDYANQGSENINSSMPDGKFAGTITHTSSHTHAFFMGNYTTGVSGLNDYFYYKEFQVEVNSHPTPYTTGTRSSTQGLIDLTGRSTIDLSNVSFDSNATITWDGTDDFLSGAGSINYPVSWTDAYTLECMVYVPSSAVWTNSFFSSLIMKGSYKGSHGLVRSNTNNQIGMWARGDNGAVAAYTSIVRDAWTHIVGVWTGDRTEIYKNGVLESFSGTARTGIPDGGAWRIGRASAASGNTGNTFDGEIPIVKFYNRALTPQEVQANYSHYRTRFNI